MKRPAQIALLAGIAAAGLATGSAAAEPTTILSSSSDDYAEGGVEVCTTCHDENSPKPVLSIFATPHGVKADERTPMGSPHGCQSCHGPSAAHVRDQSPVPVVFREDAPVEPQNAACLACHQGGARMNWAGSAHQSAQLRCTSCHTIHAKEDPVAKVDVRPNVVFKDNQSAVCFQCHQEKRAQFFRLSHHPVTEGKIACTNCHNPHGSMAPKLLVKPTLNETCYQCHADKRGPFLWEHPPAREDCTNCHEPHGSNHPTLLVNRLPLLCQQCHMAAFHPSTAYTGVNASAGVSRLDIHAAAKSCLNCHSEVHGSNHPSGPRLMR